MSKFPFFVDENSNYMRISKSVFYKLTYNDYYKGGMWIVLYNETNDRDLVRWRILTKNSFTFFSFNAVFQIDLKDGQTHNEISIFLEAEGSIFAGSIHASFYIKYLHP